MKLSKLRLLGLNKRITRKIRAITESMLNKLREELRENEYSK